MEGEAARTHLAQDLRGTMHGLADFDGGVTAFDAGVRGMADAILAAAAELERAAAA